MDVSAALDRWDRRGSGSLEEEFVAWAQWVVDREHSKKFKQRAGVCAARGVRVHTGSTSRVVEVEFCSVATQHVPALVVKYASKDSKNTLLLAEWLGASLLQRQTDFHPHLCMCGWMAWFGKRVGFLLHRAGDESAWHLLHSRHCNDIGVCVLQIVALTLTLGSEQLQCLNGDPALTNFMWDRRRKRAIMIDFGQVTMGSGAQRWVTRRMGSALTTWQRGGTKEVEPQELWELPYGDSLPYVTEKGEPLAANGICFQLCAHLSAFHNAPGCDYGHDSGRAWVESLCQRAQRASFAEYVKGRGWVETQRDSATCMYAFSFDAATHHELAAAGPAAVADSWTRWGWRWLRDRALDQVCAERNTTPERALRWFTAAYPALHARLVAVAPDMAMLGIGRRADACPAPAHAAHRPSHDAAAPHSPPRRRRGM